MLTSYHVGNKIFHQRLIIKGNNDKIITELALTAYFVVEKSLCIKDEQKIKDRKDNRYTCKQSSEIKIN